MLLPMRCTSSGLLPLRPSSSSSHYQSNHNHRPLQSRGHILISSEPCRCPLHISQSAADPIEAELAEGESDELDVKVGVEEVKGKKNRRIIKAEIRIDAQLETIWAVLTNYEGLADFIPSLKVSQLLDYKDNVARVYQVGQQELALGLKFSAKGVIECYENEIQNLSPSSRRRAIDFKMVDGDFKVFHGEWCIQQGFGEFEEDGEENSMKEEEFGTKLLYMVELQPKFMVPVQLIENRLCREIKNNLLSVRDEAQRIQRLQN